MAENRCETCRVDQCSVCQTMSTCQTCTVHYYLTKVGTCEKCFLDNCDECSMDYESEVVKCEECKKGFEWNEKHKYCSVMVGEEE